MDEEDLAELREGQKLVDTNEEMDLLTGTQAELRQKGGRDEPEKECVRYTHLIRLSYTKLRLQCDHSRPRSFHASSP